MPCFHIPNTHTGYLLVYLCDTIFLSLPLRKQRLVDCHNCPLSTNTVDPPIRIDCAQLVAAHISQPGIIHLNSSWLTSSAASFMLYRQDHQCTRRSHFYSFILDLAKKLLFRMLTVVLQSGHHQRKPPLMSDLS